MKKHLNSRLYGSLLVLSMMGACATTRTEKRGEESKTFNLSYGPHRRNILDLWVPEKIRTDAPLVVLVHGGGWVFGDKSHIRQIQKFLHSQGYPTLSLNYRLAGNGVTYHEQLSDLHQAIQTYDAQRSTHPMLPKSIVLMGESAGGHLSLLYGYQHPERISKLVSLAGPADIVSLAQTSHHRPRPGFGLVGVAFSPDGKPTRETLLEASPIQYVSKVPTLIFQGTADRMVPENQGRHLADVLKQKGIPYRMVVSPGRGHVSRLFSYAWRDKVLYGELLRFLQADQELSGLEAEAVYP